MKNNVLFRSIKMALKTSPKDCILMFLIQLFIACIPVGLLYALRNLIDSMSENIGMRYITYIVLYCFFIWIQRAVQDWFNHYFLVYFSLLRFEKRIKGVFFRICKEMNLDDYNDAELVNHSLRAKNASVNIMRLYQAVVELVCAVISVLVMGIILNKINNILLLGFALMSIVEIADNIFLLIQNKKLLYQNTQLEKEEEEIANLLLSAKSLKEILLLNGTSFVREKWKDSVDELIKNEKIKNKKVFLFSSFMKILYCGGMIFSYLLMFKAFSDGRIGISEFSVSVSAFVMLKNIFNNLFEEVSNISQFAVMVTPFFEYEDNLMKHRMLSVEDESVSGNDSTKCILDLKDVYYQYYNSNHYALEKINLSIEKGKKYVIVGENGSGKTTLIKILMGLFTPTSGCVLKDGVNIVLQNEDELYKAFSDVPQEFNMYAIALKDNVLFVHDNKVLDIDSAFEDMSLEDIVTEKDKIIGKDFGGIELSGGQKQKIAILRAENKGGEVFCFDEPTSAIDPLQEKKIFDRIYRISKGKTTIIVSHRMALCRLADYIIVLENGKIVEIGSHMDLMKNKGLYEKMFTEQASLYKI